LSLHVSRQMLLQEYTQAGNNDGESIFDGSHHFSLRVQRALSLIDAGTEQRLNVAELAAQVGLSRRQLLRLFRREIGKTPAEVLMHRRLERAHSLVLHSHLPLAVVSSAVGFSSQSHMTSSFKKFFGTTPAEHRRSHQMRS
jgi:transcriptional regulator GlxA family with amidase domain